MSKYLVTGIAPLGDPNALNRALRKERDLAGLRLTIVGSLARGDISAARNGPFVHTGIVEVVDSSTYPQSSIHTGQNGTTVPGINASSPSITFIEHPTVFDYLRDLDLPYDLAVNYNLAIEAGRNVVVCEVEHAQAAAVEAAFHHHGLRNVHTVARALAEVALTP